MPEKCETFELVVDQTCDDIMKEYGMTKAQFAGLESLHQPVVQESWRLERLVSLRQVNGNSAQFSA